MGRYDMIWQQGRIKIIGQTLYTLNNEMTLL